MGGRLELRAVFHDAAVTIADLDNLVLGRSGWRLHRLNGVVQDADRESLEWSRLQVLGVRS